MFCFSSPSSVIPIHGLPDTIASNPALVTQTHAKPAIAAANREIDRDLTPERPAGPGERRKDWTGPR